MAMQPEGLECGGRGGGEGGGGLRGGGGRDRGGSRVLFLDKRS